MAVSVVIDTDLGNNIDDAFALSLAAISPEIDLLGVTTTWYQAASRAFIVRRLLGAWGRMDVPVSAGQHPRYERESEQSHRYFTLQSFASPTPPLAPWSGQPAMEWLKELLGRQRITYIATAPLTNLAELLEAHPELAQRIERVVLMGGWASQALPEWNVYQDPESAAVVIRSGVPVLAIGYEVTLNCILSTKDVKALYGADHPGSRFLAALYDRWSRATGQTPPVMYDPLTVAALIDPTLIEYEEKRVDVQTAEGPAFGVMYTDPEKGYPVQTAVGVNRRKYLQLLIDRLGAPSSIATTVDQSNSPRLGSPTAEAPSSPTVSPGDVPSAIRDVGPAPVPAKDLRALPPRSPSTIPQVEIREGIELNYYPGWRMPRAVAVAHTMAVIVSGSGQIGVEGEPTHQISEGDLIYLACNEAYSLETELGMSLELISFDAWYADFGTTTQPEKWTRRLFDLPIKFGRSEEVDGAGRMLRRIVYSWRRPSVENMLEAHGLLMRLLSRLILIRAQQVENPDIERYNLVQRTKQYLERHVEGNVKLDDLSQEVGMSKYHLIRLYKEAERMTPMQYYRLLKMRRARSLLELSTLSIKEIAGRLGYSSPTVFSRAFQAEMSMSPGEYRRMIQSPGGPQ